MNWGLISWIAGVMLTLYGIKFVIMAIRTLLSKDTMNAVLDAAGSSVNTANVKFKRYLKKKASSKKSEQKKIKPIITIR